MTSIVQVHRDQCVSVIVQRESVPCQNFLPYIAPIGARTTSIFKKRPINFELAWDRDCAKFHLRSLEAGNVNNLKEGKSLGLTQNLVYHGVRHDDENAAFIH